MMKNSFLIAGLVLISAFSGAAGANIMRYAGSDFLVQNDEGNVMAHIAHVKGEDGVVSLKNIYSKRSFFASPSGLSLYDSNGNLALMLAVLDGGMPTIIMNYKGRRKIINFNQIQ